MATIKELADLEYPFRWPGGQPTWADRKRIEGFITGGNIVLEEIEKALEFEKDNHINPCYWLKEKIKELKGE